MPSTIGLSGGESPEDESSLEESESDEDEESETARGERKGKDRCPHRDKEGARNLVSWCQPFSLFFVDVILCVCVLDIKKEKQVHKQAVKEEQREKRKKKVPKFVKKRKERVHKMKHGK